MNAAKFWLWISAGATLAGWSLSIVGQLNRTGYSIILIAAVIAVFLARPKIRLPQTRKLRRRFGRPLPLAFAILALLVFLGGAIYPPTNYTGLNYRLARTLQWLAHDGWVWIHTPNFRMNDRACGIEWLSAPLVLFTKSDRCLFVLNFVQFLLLPGLVFTVFRRLGVRRRVAWTWMWLVPTGYNFLTQAGSIANDTFPTAYALAMVAFGARAWVSRRPADLWHALLAAALMTGAKASNLPLLLALVLLVAPLIPILFQRWAFSTAVLLVCAVVSFLPNAIINIYYLHDWTGSVVEGAHMTMKNPFVGVWGNALQLLFNNFLPPVFPIAGWWNNNFLNFAPHFFSDPLTRNFEPGYFLVPEIPTDDWASFGLGCSTLLLVSLIAAWKLRPPGKGASVSTALPQAVRWGVLIAPWISLLVYSMKSGIITPHRIIGPYYPLLLPLLLIPAGQAVVVRRRWWGALVGISLVLALGVLILQPDRPLWPAKTILSKLSEQHPGQHLFVRALKVYSVYGERNDAAAGVRAFLPANEKIIAFVCGEDDCDVSLWRPFGSRRVDHFSLFDSTKTIRTDARYAVIAGGNLSQHEQTIDRLLQNTGAELVGETNVLQKISEGVQPWYVVHFPDK